MKKLLTVSLVALMSVTAANAADELAAKTYVDGAYTAATQYTDTQIGDLGTSTDVVDYVADQLAGVTGGTITGADGQATTVSGAIAELQDEVELKANAADVYTKDAANAAFDAAGAADDALDAAKAFAQNGANLTAGTVAKTALSTEVQASLGKADTALQAADIADKADKADTLAGYGITDAYTKTEANAAFTTSDEVNALIEEDYCPAGQARVGNACVTVVTTFTAPASL